MRLTWWIQMGIGTWWFILAAAWGVLMAVRIISGDSGDEWRFNLLACLLCWGMSTQAFHHATVLIKLDARKDPDVDA